jgi:hypothetical protein
MSTDTPDEGHPFLTPEVERMLSRTPIAHWASMALVLDPESSARLMTRGQLAAELRGNDLSVLAHECEVRRVAFGGLLVLFVSDAEARFRVLFDPRKKATR